MEWESNFPCNFCGSNQKKVYMVNPRKKWYGGKPLRLVECTNCHLVYADPRPNFKEIVQRSYMRMDGFAKNITLRKLSRPNVYVIHRSIVQLALRYCKAKNPSLFDVGTGAGTLLMEAKKLGLKVAGNDINKYSCHMLNEQGITAYNLSTQELELDETFDIITMLDYLEHTYTPYDDLKWAWNHLNPEGVLLFKTLFLGCPDHRREGDDWKLFEAGHFHFFYPHVLYDMTMQAGFDILNRNLKSRAIIRIIARKVEKQLKGLLV